MKTSILFAGVSAFAIIAGQQAAAQNFYAGLGYENSNTSWSDGVPDSDFNAASVLLGYRHNLANSFFVGGEVETSLSTDYSFSGSSSGLSMDRVSRLRFLAGYDFGQFAVFGALGGTQMTGDFLGASTNDEMSGMTFGIGGEYAATDTISLRLEALQDQLSGDAAGINYDWDNTGLRAAAIFKF